MTALHVQRFGAGERTLVALHGVTGHGARFRRLADALPGVAVHAVDLRGHGRSPWLPPWTVEQHVADVVETLAGEEVDLLGFSFGGFIAIHVAHALGRRVRRLVLLDPGIGLPPRVADSRAVSAMDDLSFVDIDAARAMRAEAWPFADAETVDAEVAEHLQLDDDGRYRWRVHRPAVVTAFSEMARPALLPPRPADTLLVIGDRSPVVEQSYEHACREAGVQVARLDCGHQLMIERPADTGRIVREFLT
jgi:lipase